MLIAEANVETGRSRRYLVELCRHVDKAGAGAPADAGARRMVRPRGDQLRLGAMHAPCPPGRADAAGGSSR